MTTAQPASTVSEKDDAGFFDRLPAFAVRPVAVVCTVFAAVLTALSGRYGYHRDELYFLAAADHPAWGYVDQPPLTPMLARASVALFGNTPVGLRVIATVLGVAAVVLVVLIARELGGGRRAQVIAACCAAGSGIVLGLAHLLATATVDLVGWLAISWLVLRLLRTRDGRWYLVIGLAVGLALLNKHLVALLVPALLVSVLAVGPRRVLASWWLLAGVAIAATLALPNVLWNIAHDWPQLAVAEGISAEDGDENRAMFVPLQLLQLSPLFVPVWLVGLIRLWRDPTVRWARSFGLAYPLLAIVVLAVGGKSYYVLPLLLVATAAGAVWVAGWTAPARWRMGFVASVIAAGTAVNLVVSLPVLPPSALGVVNAANPEQGAQLGWPQLVSTVADGWQLIPAAQRDHAVIFAQNYGEAGAIARFGPEHGLPTAYSGHMSYADWGPPPDSADGPVLLVHDRENQRIARLFGDCRAVGSVPDEYGVDAELWRNVVTLCSGPSQPWSQLWPRLRHY